MKPETIETITRHLKGIVAALEKEKTPMVYTFMGKRLDECTDDEILSAYRMSWEDKSTSQFMGMSEALHEQSKKRNLGEKVLSALKASFSQQ